MHPSRCVYCGSLAENPTRLSWAIVDDEQGPLTVSLPLCVACSQSWCSTAQTCPAACVEEDAA